MSQAPPSGRRTFAFVARIAIGLAVLGFVVLRRPGELSDVLSKADVGYLAAAAVTLFAGIFVSALRWRSYLEALEIPLKLPSLFRLYFVGTFFNAFLPTGIGGDAYKAIRIGRARGRGAMAFASVFLDRFAGLVALSFIGLGGVIAEMVSGASDLRLAVVSLVLSAGIIGGALLVLLFGDRLIARFVPERGWGEGVRRAMRGIHEAGRHPVAAARGYALGFVFQGFVLIAHLFLARALGLRGVGAGAMAGVLVLSQMATLIPLTVNGLGFREAAYVWGLGVLGVAAPDARAFAVLLLAILLTTSLVGGAVYVVRGGDVAAER